MKNIDQKYIDELISSYLAGESSKEEKAVLFEWIETNESNKARFLNYKKIWNESLVAKAAIDNEMKWIDVKKRTSKSPLGYQQLLRIAAVFIIALGLGVGITFYFTLQSLKPELVYNEMIVPYGGEAEVILSDGSKVKLNAGSRLKYPAVFHDAEREVFLEGEGFFEVASNKKHPFVVSTSNIKVKATGTMFNVNAYEDEPITIATLVEGEISVSTGNDKTNEVILKPNQTATYVKKSGALTETIGDKQEDTKISPKKQKLNKVQPKTINVITKVNPNVYTSWKDKIWVIEGEKLESFAKKLERRFDINIIFDSDELKNFRFTGKLEDEPLEQVLQLMELTAPMKYTIEGKKVNLRLDKTIGNYNDLYEN